LKAAATIAHWVKDGEISAIVHLKMTAAFAFIVYAQF